MAQRDVRKLFCALAILIEAAAPLFAQTQTLSGHIPEAVKSLNLQAVGRLPASEQLHLAIGLPLRNQAVLNNLLQQIYDPASPQYHHYLTTEQFTKMFGPTESDYQAVIAFAMSNGLAVTATHPNRVVLDVAGAVADVEKALHLTMRVYNHPQEARTFFAPDAEPSLNLSVPVLHIGGLDNYSLPHPAGLRVGPSTGSLQATPNAGSQGGQYIGNDFRAAYVPGTSLTGSGQIVALLEFDGYFPGDITYYESLAGLPDVTLTNVAENGGVCTPGSGVAEVSLDIEMVIAMAPGVSKVVVYEAPNPSPFEDLINPMATDNLAKQISCSWSGGGAPDPTAEQGLVEMALQGQSFFCASGDTNAYVGAIPFPCDSTNITEVGGTTLSTTGPGGSYVSETVWNWGVEFGSSENGVGSSGGISTHYSIPPWQQGVSMASNQGSTTNRNVPDVALTADHVFVAYGNGSTNWFGGTSCAAPLWAGFTALVNQQGAANGKPTVGFLNPAIYTIGTGTSYTVCFHDITAGNNEWTGSPDRFSAVAGYDLCTGWGSPNGTNLINALVGPPPNAPVLAVGGSTVSGGNGTGVIDADGCNSLNLFVQNIGGGTATTVNATLSTSTPGVTITQPSSTYPTLPPITFATNSTPFQVSTSPSFVCGTPIALSLALSYVGGSNTTILTLPTCQCLPLQTNGSLSATSPTQTGRLTRNGTVSACCAAKSCPGDFATSGAYAYQTYSFTNSSSGAVCVTVTLSTSCSGLVFSESYLGSFHPTSLCSNYLADLGSSPTTTASFSFDVPANTNFTVVINAVNVGSYCSSYTVTIAGLPCPMDGGGSCAGVSASFTGTPTNGAAPLAVTFTDTSTGTITNRFWNFGDGATTNTTTNILVHVYSTAGTDTVTLIVSGPPGTSTNTQPNYIVVTPAADLVLTNTAAPNPVAQGQDLNYTLTVTNLGPSTATSVTITDALPADVALVSAATTQGSCTNVGGTVFCNLGNLAVATNAVVIVIVTPSTPGIITNTAFVFATTPDPNVTNNTAVAITAVNPAADLSITKTGAPNPVLTSQHLTYTLVVTNLGPSAASSVTITDALPAGVSVVSATATSGSCTNVGGLVTCSLGDLATNAAATVTIVGTATSASSITSITNTATVSSTAFDPTLTNDTAMAALTVYLDSVGDGIPDWWRAQYFPNQPTNNVNGSMTNGLSCATCDADGTGQNNLFKYVAGLDPTNPASVLTLSISSVTNQSTWESLLLNPFSNGRTYTPQFSTDLVSGIWLPLTGFAGPVSNGNQITITDTNAVLPYEFYRIHISLP